MKTTAMLLAMACCAGAARAGDISPVAAIAPGQTHPTQFAYYDAATNTWAFGLVPVWLRGECSVYDANGTLPGGNSFLPQDDPVRTTPGVPKFGTEALSWGDIEFNMTVDQVVLVYATNIPDAGAPGVAGFGCNIRFYDGDAGTNDPVTQENIALTVTGLPGSTFATGYAVWNVLIQLDASSAFELGDTDGVDQYGNLSSLAGADEDFDGDADFSWSYQFMQSQAAKGVVGPLLCSGGNHHGYHDMDNDRFIDTSSGIDTPLNSGGTSDRLWDWYSTPPHTGLIGTFRFPGSPPPGSVFNIELRGPVHGDSVLDLNANGQLELGDMFNFLNRFDGC